jgi:hypothetical protein
MRRSTGAIALAFNLMIGGLCRPSLGQLMTLVKGVRTG